MENKNLHIEAYPQKIQIALEKRDRKKRDGLPSSVNGWATEAVFEDLKLWRVGVLKVSFKGGNSLLHQKIANVADEWSDFGNIKFDWGYNPQNNTYRTWDLKDTSHIRVGFGYSGYWSLVGIDSVDNDIISNHEISLNLADFDSKLPENWEGVVLHEFGHALGFHHEHQSPSIYCDFDWPTLYDYLGGPPNYWSQDQVDHNLKKLRSGGLTYSAHDKHSIMHYSFPQWMFLSGSDSPCYTEENSKLSSNDQEMMSKAYPQDLNVISERDNYRLRNLEILTSNSIYLKEHFQEHLSFYKDIVGK